MLAYSFTSKPIAEALIEAHDRGVDVQAVLDKSDTAGSSAPVAALLAGADIPVLIDSKHAIAHNKVMIIDGQVVLTGSFNFTNAAEHANAENLLCLRDSALATIYARNWSAHASHSDPYKAPTKKGP